MIAAVILAAGASSRMGSPKALLDYHGEVFLNRLIRVLGRVCDPVVAVLGYGEEQIRSKINGQVLLATNPKPERGQLSSLQTGLRAVPLGAEGFLFTPVDSPAVLESTIDTLAERFRSRGPQTLFVIPRCKGKRGHPVFAAPELIRDFLALGPGAQAKDLVHRHIPQTEYVDVDDAGILADIDDPAAYRDLVGERP
jgi:molybdenum cofactor cytidylyltransferase